MKYVKRTVRVEKKEKKDFFWSICVSPRLRQRDAAVL